MKQKYSADGAGIRTLTTRRGIDATIPLMCGKVKIGECHDEASAIVAKVDFISDEHRKAFLAEAKAMGFDRDSDSFTISEYARCLGHEAEAAHLEKKSDDRHYVKGMRYRYSFDVWKRGDDLEGPGHRLHLYTVEKLREHDDKQALTVYVRNRGYKSAAKVTVLDPVVLTPPGKPTLAAAKKARDK